MIKENKVRKYLLYAIGEIMLVVIGILIAVSINSWNEERKSKKVEIEVLKSLSHDVEKDSYELQKIDSLYQIDILKLNKAYDLITKGHLTQEESLNLKYLGVTLIDFNPRLKSYDEMIHSGKIYYLSNRLLVENIIDYYEEIEDLIYETRQARNEFRAVLYGPHLNDFWLTHNYSDPNYTNHVYNFYNNPDAKEYRILKQISSWSVILGQEFQTKASNLTDTNRSLFKKIEAEIAD